MNWKYWVVSVLLVVSCAIESVPSGGPKDITPPEIVKANPENFSIQFDAEKIVLTFDEYVELKNFSQQFSISPPIEGKVDHFLKGKNLTIELPDSLLPNTTYTLNFGNAIVDITEGNAQTIYKYVFSTGDVLDSLKVRGFAHHAFSGSPVEGALAMLYPENATDSFAFKNKPLYYSVTQEDGSFSIENVSDQPYRLIVVDDKDFNFKVSSNQELLGFEGEILDPVVDTVYHARMFNGERDLEFNLARQVGFGKAELYYSNDVPEGFAVSFEKERELFLDFDKGRDTIVVWFDELEGDTTLFYNTYDSRLDTVFLRKADFDKKEFTLKEKQVTVTPSSILTLISDMPIVEINSAFCTFVKNEDTIPTPKLTLSESSYEIEIEGDIAFGDQYQLHVLPDFATSFFGDQADTSSYKFSTKKERDYAFHIINLEQFSGQQSIIQLLDKKNNVVFEKVVLGSEKFDVPFLDPDSYVLRLIIDRNKNNKWDTGDYLNQVQPEKVIYYPDPIELRANWEIETIWKIK